MILTAVAAFLALRQQADAWTLEPKVDVKAPKEIWATVVDAESGGMQHHAVFNLTRVTKSVTPEKTVQSFKWEKLSIDDQEGQEIEGWDAVVGKRGELLKMDGTTDDDFRRMLSPLVFTYPENPISVGNKWTLEVKPSGNAAKFTYEYEAKSTETVEGTNALLIAVTASESGTQPIKGTGFWWVSRVGKVLKFEMKLENWIVPMAGSEVTNVVIRGKAI